MSVIKWRESFNTGIEQFDEEHKKIVELVQGVFEAVKENRGGDFEKVIQELVDYTGYHFTNEEQAMMADEYPEIEQHRKEHQKLMEQAANFQEISKDMNKEQVQKFYRFLRDWLLDHIINCDKKYGEYVALL